jgi:hypothetical protein
VSKANLRWWRARGADLWNAGHGRRPKGPHLADPACGGVTLGKALLPPQVLSLRSESQNGGRRWRPHRVVVSLEADRFGRLGLASSRRRSEAQATLLSGSESAFGGGDPGAPLTIGRVRNAVADESGTANDSGRSVREGRWKQGSLRLAGGGN